MTLLFGETVATHRNSSQKIAFVPDLSEKQRGPTDLIEKEFVNRGDCLRDCAMTFGSVTRQPCAPDGGILGAMPGRRFPPENLRTLTLKDAADVSPAVQDANNVHGVCLESVINPNRFKSRNRP